MCSTTKIYINFNSKCCARKDIKTNTIYSYENNKPLKTET